MNPLALHDFHESHGATFGEVAGCEVVRNYGEFAREYASLHDDVAVLDLGFRGRLCLTGTDRVRFLHGQVTNAIQGLAVHSTCYTALVTAKGKMVSDLEVICLLDELLLDFEPGCTVAVRERLEKFIIADDVQVIDVAAHYGLLSVQGPKAADVLTACLSPSTPFSLPPPGKAASFNDPVYGELCCRQHARGTADGYDLFLPTANAASAIEQLAAQAARMGGRLAGWDALECIRVEAGLPRFGQDMDESHLAPETGIESRAISYSKGCYIGQEVIARIRTYGQVTKALRGLLLPDDIESLPAKGTKLVHDGKEVGHITSAVHSPRLRRNIALGYVRKECNQIGTELKLSLSGGDRPVQVVAIPFVGKS